MIDVADDLEHVFYGADFAATFLRRRAATQDKVVQGILGIVSEEAFDGRVTAPARVLRLPVASDVRRGDVLIVQTGMPSQGVPVGAAYKVLEPPQQVGDGSEIEAQLGSVGP